VGSLEDYVDIIMEVAGHYGIPVLDLHRVSGLQPEDPDLRQRYMPDGLHPNDDGHAIIHSRLKGFLETL
jgi:lysophospholipase L1-like esterase